MSRAGWCRHYRGTAEHATCSAGVEYESVKKETGEEFKSMDGVMVRVKNLPCIEKHNKCGATCDSRDPYTLTELALEEEAQRVRFEKITKARAAIVEACGGPWNKKKHKGQGHRGRINCPVCGAAEALAFSRSGYNGHIHARCSTPECVAWME